MHSAGAFLAVWTEPGESVKLEEFQGERVYGMLNNIFYARVLYP
jgi:hypothetical protein